MANVQTSPLEGFKFAIATIIAASTIEYKIHDYIENNPITHIYYCFSLFILMLCGIISGCLLVYIVLKALSFEKSDITPFTEKMSFICYISTFEIFYLFITGVVGLFIWVLCSSLIFSKNHAIIVIVLLVYFWDISKIIKDILKLRRDNTSESIWKPFQLFIKTPFEKLRTSAKDIIFISGITSATLYLYIGSIVVEIPSILASLNSAYLIISLIILILIGNEIFFKESNSEMAKLDIYALGSIRVIFYIVIVALLIIMLIYYPYKFPGELTIGITINDISISDTPVPINMITEGDSQNTTINLTKSDLKGNVSILDSIEVYPVENTNKVFYGTCHLLRASTLDYGKYKIFINTTNLTQDYYEISFSENLTQVGFSDLIRLNSENHIQVGFSDLIRLNNLKLFNLPINKTTFNSFYLARKSQ